VARITDHQEILRSRSEPRRIESWDERRKGKKPIVERKREGGGGVEGERERDKAESWWETRRRDESEEEAEDKKIDVRGERGARIPLGCTGEEDPEDRAD